MPAPLLEESSDRNLLRLSGEMTAPEEASRSERELSPASAGVGPLLQRDYWAFIASPACCASQVGELLASRFAELAPPSYVRFRRRDGEEGPLEVGDDLEVTIRLAGTFGVRVVHRNANSITFATLRGHPESGRITFGAYRNSEGKLIFHIRSRTRVSSRLRYAGFLALGESLQTNAWGELIKRAASIMGEGVEGSVEEETHRIPDELEEQGQPTYIAAGD